MLHNSNSSSQNEEEIVEVDLKWQSPTPTNKSSAKSPTMPRRSDPSLDETLLAVSAASTSTNASSIKSHSLSPVPTSSRKNKPKAKSLTSNLHLEMSFSSFSNLVEAGISPPPKMPHRRTSTCADDVLPNIPGGEQGKQNATWQTNQAVGNGQQDEFYMDLNDKKPGEKKKIRRVRRGVQRAFSDSELSEASTICSRDEGKKKRKEARKKSLLQRRKAQLAAKLLGRGENNNSNSDDEGDHASEEDDDVNDTDKDLEGFTGIALKKSAHSAHTTTLTQSSHHTQATSDNVETVGLKKSQSEIQLEVRSRVSKSPARFPRGSDQSRSRGRARSTSRHGSSVAGDDVAAAAKMTKKKKRSSGSRTKRQTNRKKTSSDESDSSDEEYEKERASSKSRGSKSPRRRKKSKGARRVPKKGARKPMQAPPVNDNSMSQRTWTGAVIDANVAELVSPCTMGSGRPSIRDVLSPTDRSRDTKVSAITMSTGMISPNFSGHSAFTQSSLRGPQHIPGFQPIPDLEASEHARVAAAAEEGQQSDSLLTTGNLSAVFEVSSRNELELATSGRDSDEAANTPPKAATPRSSLRMPTVPRRRPSTDQSVISLFVQKGPLFDSAHLSEATDRTDDNESEELFDRFAAMNKQKSSSDLMNLVEPQQQHQQRPSGLMRKASSERNITSTLKSGAARVWRRGKKKPKEEAS